jgi:hypothetical protein
VDTGMSPGTRLTLWHFRPTILDPADPTGNLGHNARWDLLAKEAVACMAALCCTGRDGAPIPPWPVKVREERGTGWHAGERALHPHFCGLGFCRKCG